MTITSVTTSTTSGTFTETSGNTLLVLNSGIVSAATIASGGTLIVSSGGQDFAAIIQSGGTATISGGGSATGDFIYGAATVSGGATAVIGETVESGGKLLVSSGGVVSGTTILAGGTEFVSAHASATGDFIYGAVSTISAGSAAFTGETVESGGLLSLLNGDNATGTLVLNGGLLFLNGNVIASNTTLSGGGVLELDSPKATLSGTLTFAGGGNTLEAAVLANTTTAGLGDQAVISGFGATDRIDVQSFGLVGAALTVTTSGSNNVVTVSSGGTSESFIFSGTTTYTSSTLSLTSDGSGGVDVVYSAGGGASGTVTSVTTPTASGTYTETSGNTLLVLSGGIVSAAAISSGGSLVVSGGGEDFAATVFAGGTEAISSGGSAAGDTFFGAATVVSGGTISSATVSGGGSLTINAGAADSGSVIAFGGTEILLGSASGDQIFGTQVESSATAVVAGETIENGGIVELLGTSSTVSGITVSSGGVLSIGANIPTSDTVLVGGGTVVLASAKATLTGALTFSGGNNTLDVVSLVTSSAGAFGEQAAISGFSSTDQIVISGLGSGATLSFSTSAGNEIVKASGSLGSETFVFSGTTTYTSDTVFLVSSGTVFDLEYSTSGITTSVTTSTGSGAFTEAPPNTLLVLGGGSISAAVIEGGAFLVISGGDDFAATISANATETVASGSATGDQIFGSAVVESGAVAGGETVGNGGTLVLSGGGTSSDTVLNGHATAELVTAADTLSGVLTFANGSNTLDIAALASAGDGDQAVISGYSPTDNILISGLGAGVTLSFATSGSNEVVTVSGANGAESLIFSGTSAYGSDSLSIVSASGVVDLQYTSITSVTGSSGGYVETNHETLLVLSGGIVSGATIESGGSLIVSSGGQEFGAIVSSGGVATIESGGNAGGNTIFGSMTISGGATDSGSTVGAGGSQTVLGSATGDWIYGTQVVSDGDGTVVGETVGNGGVLVLSSGSTASNTVLNGGGTVELLSPTATLDGSFLFANGGNTLDVVSLSSSGAGDQAVISGFSNADKIVISGIGSDATLSVTTSGGNEIATVSGSGGSESFIFVGTSTYTSAMLSLVTSGATATLETAFAASDLTILPYDSSTASTISASPLALYAVPVDEIAPTQMNEGFAEIGSKAAGYDQLTTYAALEANLATNIEPVIIGPGGQLYLLDGHHTFTSLEDSVWGAQNPIVYVNVIANFSGDTEAEFWAQMQADNFLLPLNEDVPQTVDVNTGAPIPATLTGLTNDPYRSLEYLILKQKDSVLFTNSSNITGASGSSKPGLDKMPGQYSDFAEAAAYQDALNGLGLPYLSPGDVAIATDWNLNGNSTTTLPNVSGTVHAYQLPGFILGQNITVSSSISNATMGQTVSGGTVVPGSMQGAIDGAGTFTGITEINAGTLANPIYIDTPNIGFILQLGNDKGFTVTLSNDANTYVGGTTLLAGRLVIAGDGSLGAAPTETNQQFDNSLVLDSAGFPTNVTAAVQADNGIIFNSLSEGNGTITIGTTAGEYTSGSPFVTERPIAVGNEAATIDVNGSVVELDGQLVSLGYANLGLGETTGFPAFTIDDLSGGGGSSATAGKVILSTASPYFYGDIIIGNTGTPTVEVMSDAALGNTTGPEDAIGEVELNGGTLQTGASFDASERNLFLNGGSQIDLAGNTTTWGTLTDVKRTIAIGNSSANAAAITFNNLVISETSILQLDGSADGATYNGAETVTFTNGINQTDAADTLVLSPSSGSALGTTEKVFSNGPSTTLVNGIAPVWIVTNEGNSSGNGPYDFVTYGANGYVQETSGVSTLDASTGSDVVELGSGVTANSSVAAYALNTNGNIVSLGANTLTIGDGTDEAGLILDGGAINGGTLAFGTSEGVIWLNGSSTISSEITGSNGLTFAGNGTVTIGTAANVSGPITVDSGVLVLSAADVFANDAGGLNLGDVKSHPAAPTLDVNASNTFTTLNTAGTNAAINLTSGAALTLGDTTNNLDSTISSKLTESGTAVAGALTLDGSGLFDFSGGKSGGINLVSGSTIVVNDTAQLRVAANTFANANFSIDLAGAGSQLQFAGGGGDGILANTVSGSGELHLIGGTLKITGTNNTYTGGTVVETGSTLDITTANLPSVNENITDAGGLIDFDQSTNGTFIGVISDGQEMGAGPMEAGSLDKDDSSGANSGDVTITQVQQYSGNTYIEAGSITLAAVNAIAGSSALVLGRVGGGATASLILAADNTLQSLTANTSNTTSVLLDGNVLTLTPASGTDIFTGVIGDGSTSGGEVVIDAASGGAVEFTGANTYTGGTVVSSGTLVLASGGVAGSGGISLHSGTTLDVGSGGTSVDAVVSSGAAMVVFSGGVANPTTIYSGGSEVVSAGGTDATAIISGGKQVDFGTATGATIFAGGQQVVRAGAVASGSVISSGGVVVDFGAASGTIVRSAGTDFVESGGVETGAVLSNGGTEFVEAHGLANGLTLSAGAVLANFGSASGTIVSNGGSDFIEAGAAETGATLLSGGTAFIEAGGVASGLGISSGGLLSDLGSASGTLVSNGGTDDVEAGGTETSATLLSGGVEYVEAGGKTVGLMVSSGGIVANYGGSESGTIVGTSALDYVEASGVETGATILNGGIEYIEAGGATNNLTVSSGGIVANYGGAASGVTVSSGGLDYVEAGAVETNAVLLNDGIEYLVSGGITNALTVSSGGILANYGGSASGTVVRNSGLDYVEAGSFETGATLSSGGIEYIEPDGTTNNLTVSSGGILANYAGSASGTIVSSGGLDFVESGGVETGASLLNGGVEYIESGGTIHSLTVSSGGIAVNYGGVASGTIVSNGGTDFIEAGAVESGATLSNGGVEYIMPGGVADGLTVLSGGIVANYGGSASGTMVSAAGQDYLEAGAIETGATMFTGGAEYVMAGGTASGVTISGGLIDITSGGAISGTVTFISGGELQLADSQDFTNLVAGFSGTSVSMDLQDITYVSGATTVSWAQTNGTSGTLTVSGGGHFANITLLGQYATGNFKLSNDGNGGTLVVDPPLLPTDSATTLVNHH